ncbi:hypothetical protein BHE74_00003231 [Ensete ventricosum]|nr:hypothetical protein BHE74_00003231 [Ensete ventricosum]RZR86430.1 hypothetical protein BHM03_00013629 [Ensete ventricosum]
MQQHPLPSILPWTTPSSAILCAAPALTCASPIHVTLNLQGRHFCLFPALPFSPAPLQPHLLAFCYNYWSSLFPPLLAIGIDNNRWQH